MVDWTSRRTRLAAQARAFGGLARAGVLAPTALLPTAGSFLWWGPSLAAGYDAAGWRHPRRVAVVDDHGSVTYGELRHRTDALARRLRRDEVRCVGVLCRNHRGFLEATIAASKAGATVVPLNVSFAAPQLAAVVAREEIDLVVHDVGFADLVTAALDDAAVAAGAAHGAEPPQVARLVADPSAPQTFAGVAPLRRPVSGLPPTSAPPPVLLTSGTTGTPKGARRSGARPDLVAASGIFQAIPYRRGDVMVVPAPLFHAWGLGQLAVAASVAGTVVLRARFDPDQVLADVAAHHAQVLAVVPTMLTRLLDAHRAADRPVDLSSLRVVASSGSALPGDLAVEWMNAVGDTLYNVYGSTEVGQVSIAGPADLRAAPGTAGRALPGTRVVVLDDEVDQPVPTGRIGRVFVETSLGFDGYTGGGDKARIGDAMSIGDRGWLDADGRLFIAGRDDDMIITGGENVYPAEIEDVLCRQPGVVEAAVVGVPDDDLGEVVVAYVVRRAAGRRSAPSAETLRRAVRAELAGYKVPKRVEFVDALPRNPAGKVLRDRLGT